MLKENAPKLREYLEKIRQGKATPEEIFEFVLLKKEMEEECERRHPGGVIVDVE